MFPMSLFQVAVNPTIPSSRQSAVLPFLLAVAAPVVVIICIDVLHSVWWTFALYQVGICLVLPAVESRAQGRSWREHAILLGLRAPETHGRHVKLAIVLAILTALVTGGFLLLVRHTLLDPSRLAAALAKWGVAPGQTLAALGVMALLDAAAEELFWRGYFPGRVLSSKPDAPVALTVLLPAMLYASYHAITLAGLVGNVVGVAVMTAGVLGAGLVWGWLRLRTGSVWPSLASHSGAVVAYLAVHLALTARS